MESETRTTIGEYEKKLMAELEEQEKKNDDWIYTGDGKKVRRKHIEED